MIIAAEMGAPLRLTSGPAITHAGDLAAILSGLERGRRAVRRRDPPDVAAGRGDALHGDGGLPGRRRHRQGAGRHRDPAGDPAVHPGRRHHPRRAAARAAARPVRLHRPPGVLRARRARPDRAPLGRLLERRARRADGAAEIASRSRGTPRIANRLLRRVRDYAQVRADGVVTRDVARARARALRGRRARASTGSTGPCSTRSAAGSAADRSASRTLAVAVGEERETVEEVAEPFLVRSGFLARTPRGRVATPAAWAHLGLTRPGAALGGRRPSSRTDPAVDSGSCSSRRLHFTVGRPARPGRRPPPIIAREVLSCRSSSPCCPSSASRCSSGCSSSGRPAPAAEGTPAACSRSLSVGDEVMLTSGIFGTVRGVDGRPRRASRSPTA